VTRITVCPACAVRTASFIAMMAGRVSRLSATWYAVILRFWEEMKRKT
jgi:hypothetical protein